MIDYLYRISESPNEYMEDGVNLFMERFPVEKETRSGVWINVYGKNKFVLLRHNTGSITRKRWACVTIPEAIESYKKRKRHELGHLTARVNIVKLAQVAIEKVDVNNIPQFLDNFMTLNQERRPSPVLPKLF